jgi:hypothetical protein
VQSGLYSQREHALQEATGGIWQTKVESAGGTSVS